MHTAQHNVQLAAVVRNLLLLHKAFCNDMAHNEAALWVAMVLYSANHGLAEGTSASAICMHSTPWQAQ
jgi:hypothetical protein